MDLPTSYAGEGEMHRREKREAWWDAPTLTELDEGSMEGGKRAVEKEMKEGKIKRGWRRVSDIFSRF